MNELRGYLPHIVSASGCPHEDAQAVEEIMRSRSGGVLDSLLPAEFEREARDCYEILGILRTDFPETAAFYERRACYGGEA